MVLNIFGGIILKDFKIIGLGILYLLLFTPFGYICWFRPAYKAFRSDSSFNFMVFFFIFFSSLGIYTAIEAFDNTVQGIIVGILALIIAIGFGCAAAADLFLISKIHNMYRSTGASMAKAQQEFTTEFLRNQHVRSAASNVPAAAVQSQFNQTQITHDTNFFYI
ncbi:hypothetical protein NQ318_003467 [Aromia moschata]|uniref:Secretory carrier-associated membrane protein n=1 Tax=Aromia moschata TaxID=1265417 RepID=A0AAV8YTP6_9CUCU|nr:hypothetical protein NQ318_003467 [Aromia moschata]